MGLVLWATCGREPRDRGFQGGPTELGGALEVEMRSPAKRHLCSLAGSRAQTHALGGFGWSRGSKSLLFPGMGPGQVAGGPDLRRAVRSAAE